MLIAEIIRKKRDGGTLSDSELATMIDGVTSGTASDAQAAAFAMAVFFRGMTSQEAAGLTLAIRDSGSVLDWSHLSGPVTDKHSTGGVGDNVSLMLAPIVAACGGFVPMISGRGLGHTGGTLDKMDAIPGYVSQPSNEVFRQTVETVGCAIIGQTADLAPADKRLYAIRDVTATVESVPLITASILSKKLAAGLGSLILDVKCGNGAFMEDRDAARDLAVSLTDTARQAGLACSAFLTDMSQPLASAAGNAVEVRSALDVLCGSDRTSRLRTLVLELAAEMLSASGLAEDPTKAMTTATGVLDSGAAAEVFERMVNALGGPSDLIARQTHYLTQAAVIRDVSATRNGTVSRIATRDIGLAVIELGGGRRRASDTIDHSVGITNLACIGTKVSEGDPIARIHAKDEADAERVTTLIRTAYEISDKAPQSIQLVIERL